MKGLFVHIMHVVVCGTDEQMLHLFSVFSDGQVWVAIVGQ